MRPNTPGSLRWIALGILVLSGCYRPWMQPGNGYGSPMYGNQYNGGYGGYQGIQTLTPGQYYDPGTTVPGTYAPAGNGLQPTPDSGSGGGGAGGGTSDGGGDAAPYNPPTEGSGNRAVPMYPDNETRDGAGNGLVPPETEGPVTPQKIDLDKSSSKAEPAPVDAWSQPTIEQASGLSEAAESTDAMETVEAPAAESTEAETEATEEEEPPLSIP